MATKKQSAGDDPLSALSSRALLLRALQRDPDGEAFYKIIWTLHKRRDRATFEAARALCLSPIPIARLLGANVLAQLGREPDSPPPFAAETVAALLPMLEREEQPDVLASLISALGWQHDASTIEPLARFKAHPNFEVRWHLALALASFSDDLALQTLIEMTRDEAAGIRDWATFGLSNLEVDTPVLREALVARLDDPDAQTRFEAMVGLAERGDERVLEAVMRALERGESGKNLFDLIGDGPDYRLLPALQEMDKAVSGGNKILRAAVRGCSDACANACGEH